MSQWANVNMLLVDKMPIAWPANMQAYLDVHNPIFGPVLHCAESKGSQHRPEFTLSLNRWLGIPDEQLAHLLETGQCLHNVSLLIDDVMNNTTVRRGRETAHMLFGTSQTLGAAHTALFQLLLDDYLDLVSEDYARKKGERASDFEEGKCSFPVVHCLRVQPEPHETFVNVFKQDVKTDADKQRLLDCLGQTSSLDYTLNRLQDLHTKIQQQLHQLRQFFGAENTRLETWIAKLAADIPGCQPLDETASTIVAQNEVDDRNERPDAMEPVITADMLRHSKTWKLFSNSSWYDEYMAARYEDAVTYYRLEDEWKKGRLGNEADILRMNSLKSTNFRIAHRIAQNLLEQPKAPHELARFAALEDYVSLLVEQQEYEPDQRAAVYNVKAHFHQVLNGSGQARFSHAKQRLAQQTEQFGLTKLAYTWIGWMRNGKRSEDDERQLSFSFPKMYATASRIAEMCVRDASLASFALNGHYTWMANEFCAPPRQTLGGLNCTLQGGTTSGGGEPTHGLVRLNRVGGKSRAVGARGCGRRWRSGFDSAL